MFFKGLPLFLLMKFDVQFTLKAQFEALKGTVWNPLFSKVLSHDPSDPVEALARIELIKRIVAWFYQVAPESAIRKEDGTLDLDKIVDWLTDQADAVVRFQGGHKAGHTLVIGQGKFQKEYKYIHRKIYSRLRFCKIQR